MDRRPRANAIAASIAVTSHGTITVGPDSIRGRQSLMLGLLTPMLRARNVHIVMPYGLISVASTAAIVTAIGRGPATPDRQNGEVSARLHMGNAPRPTIHPPCKLTQSPKMTGISQIRTALPRSTDLSTHSRAANRL